MNTDEFCKIYLSSDKIELSYLLCIIATNRDENYSKLLLWTVSAIKRAF